ncbi:uncharacterized protein LOC131854713 isoform X2 [Achroia grisella]|uniref:uncharacterized protein LOC131854713 isoform X2 n=1 Tax=Achroia grisella TaxID=688607 RepID=UPI0027D2AA67|nr:uncharacterized protein LOC131854713 isoform X2 [Achroia grisella]
MVNQITNLVSNRFFLLGRKIEGLSKMSDVKSKAESMLFDDGSTYRTCYKLPVIKESAPTTYHAKVTPELPRWPPLKDVQTMSDWKATPVPFHLLHKPRDMSTTDMGNVEKVFEKPKDLGREHAQKTRPRLVMTPAVSMDDVDDARAREILCTDMYTTATSKAWRDTVTDYIQLPAYRPPYVPLEWRMESVTWDKKQLRSYCDPTREFWLAKGPSKCRPCDESAAAHRKMKY